MADIFISYSRKDVGFAKRLAEVFETNGMSVWWDRNLIGGTKFRKVIEDELSAAGKIVVLWSNNSIGSPFVLDEAGVALQLDKFVPLAIDECVFPLGFRSIHTLRVTDLDTHAPEILKACGVTPSAQTIENAASAAQPSQPQSIPNSPGSRRGSDLSYDLYLTLEEAFTGKVAKLTFPALAACSACQKSGTGPDGGKCPECGGSGWSGRNDRTLQVNVPAGVVEGSRIRLTGQGEAGRNGGNPGDLYVAINIEPHPLLQCEGADLVCRLPVPMTLAGLGGPIDVPTADGKTVRVNIPANTASGSRLSLNGYGMPPIGGSGSSGTLILDIEIETPRAIGPNARKLLEQMRSFRSPADSWTHDVPVHERGLDLTCELVIPVVDAALGGTIGFRPGNGQALRVRYPEGTQNGQILRLRGRGKEGGDLYVTMRTQARTDHTPAEIETLKKLQELPGEWTHPETENYQERLQRFFQAGT